MHGLNLCIKIDHRFSATVLSRGTIRLICFVLTAKPTSVLVKHL